MERILNIPNIISAKDAAMIAAYGESAQEVLISIFNDIKKAVNHSEKNILIPMKGHSIWALKKYLSTFGYSVNYKFRNSLAESHIIISWD